jgi:hypothetical protein
MADNADRWDFNRQLDSHAVRSLPKDRHLAYPVIQQLVHEHRHFEPCEPHIRLVVDIQGAVAIADVPMDYFDKLPKLYVVSKGGNGLLWVLLDENGDPWDVRADSGSRDMGQAVEYFIKHCDDPKAKKSVEARKGSLT